MSFEGTFRAETMADHIAIQQVLCRYARGIDRCDEPLLKSVWWPESKADYGSGEVDAQAWSAGVIEALKAMLRTQHFLGNMLIDIDGDRAEAETYCRAVHELDGPDGRVEMEVGGRYLDRLERRDGEWRIAHRRYVLDWNRNSPSTARWDDDFYSALSRRGSRMPDDPSYRGD